MRSKNVFLIVGLAVVVIIVVVIIIVMGMNHSPSSSSSSGDMSNMNMSGSNSTSGNKSNQGVATNSVTIKNFAFSPTEITIKAGTTVTWTNSDTTSHTVTSDDGSAVQFDSGNVAPGGTFQFSFTKAGTYHYHCALHPYMKATVIVQ